MVAVALVAAAAVLAGFVLREPLVRSSYDSLHALAAAAGQPFHDPRLVVVYLDLASYLRQKQDPGSRWPRRLHARLLQQLTREGARAVVFDIVFDSPGESADDAEFASALRRNGRVVLAAERNDKSSHQTSGEQTWTRSAVLLPPEEPLLQAAAGWGIASVWVDPDLVVRRHLPPLGEDHIPSLSLATARLLRADTTAEAGRRWVRYYGPALTLPHVSYSEALDADGLPAHFFKDKIVFVGARPIEGFMDARRDEFPTPFHTWRSTKEFFAPGVEIHATQTLNLLRGDWLERLPAMQESLWLLVAPIVFGFALIRLRPGPGTVAAGGGAGLALALATAAFQRNLFFPWMVVSVAQIPAALFAAWLCHFQEWFQTRRRLEASKKAAEEKIREQAELIDKAHDAILVQDLSRQVLYANASAEKLYGWEARDLRRAEIVERIFLPDAQAAQVARAAALQSGDWDGELRQQTRSGQIIIVASRWTLIRDEAAQPKSLLLMNRDITGQKALEQQLLRTQRMNTIGALAGGMAHDLNNSLAPALLGTQLLRRKAADEEQKKLLAVIEAGVSRGAEMIRQVLLFARGRGGEFEPLAPAPLVREVEKMARETFPKNIRIERYLPPDLWRVRGNPTQLHQVLLNCCVNARDAMPEGGTLSFAADNVSLSPAEAAAFAGGRPGEFVSLLVSDTGTGMAKEVRDRLFEPFFTTKGEGQGTGIGLATVWRIVQAHSGFLRVESEPGAGTTFEILLPRAAETAAPDAAAAPTAPAGNGELVLVVDDESAVRALVADSLVAHGYRVLTAEGGEEAQRLFEQHGAEVRLVITDRAMPGMDGPQLVGALRARRPDLPVVLASAGPESEDPAAAGVSAILRKPFSLADLLAVAHRLTR